MRKKFLLGLITLCICYIVPLSAQAMTRAEFDSKLYELQQTYYYGYQWLGSFDGGSQCYGYAHMIANSVFGTYAKNWTKSYDLSGVKAGDVVQYGNPNDGNGHTIFVTDVSGDTITYTDCNAIGYCLVQWGGTVSKSSNAICSKPFSYRCVAPDLYTDPNPPKIKNFRTTNVTAQSITVSMDLSDDVGVTSVKFNIWGPNGHKGYSVSASNGTFSHTIKTSDYGGEGSYSIHVNVYDAAGNDTFAKLSGIPTPANFGDSFFGIISHHASGKPIEVGEDKYIVIGTKNGKANQVWKFQRESDGCYTIASNKTKNLLEMSGGNRENGTQASAGVEDWGGYYQRWYIYPQGDGYVILSKHYTDYRRVLDVDGGSSTDGTKILTYERLNNSNQIFDITKLTVPTLSVSAGTSAQSTVFKWNDFYGSESYYDLKLWNGTYWVGDTYRLEWNTKSPCAIHLPAGHYEGYVDFTIGKLGAMSNVVKFDVTEDNSRVNVFSRRTVTDTGYDIHADIKYLNQSAVYVAALYSSDGKLLDVQSMPVASGATSADVAFTKQAGAAYVKVFLWDSLQSMQPLTESEKINL